MDRLTQLRGDVGDSTLDTSSPPSEAFMSANESSSKYFSLSEVDSTFSISPSKDAPAIAVDTERTITEDTGIIANLSPIPKTDIETFKIGKHIEAANILSGGVNIFDDNDNSYDGDELVIDDNVVLEDEKADLKLSDETSVPVEKDNTEDTLMEGLEEEEAIPSKDTEVVLQIDGKNVDAIDIGNRLYLYRKAGEKELSAVQIVDDDQQQQSFKFLKVRENNEGNLEVYEEIQIEIPKEVPTRDSGSAEKATHVPVINDINNVINEPLCNKLIDKVNKTSNFESNSICAPHEPVLTQSESKSDVNLNGKMMKFNESRKSPLTFTPMTYHSTPNKEGIPLTKTMVDQHLHPSRHSDNIKKTIEVHTDNKSKTIDSFVKSQEVNLTTKHDHEQKHDHQSIVKAEESNIPMTIIEQTQKETLNKELSRDTICSSSDQVKEHSDERANDSIGNKIISESKELAPVVSEEIEVITTEELIHETVSDGILKHAVIKNTIEDAIDTHSCRKSTTAAKEAKESIELSNNLKMLEDKQEIIVQSPIKENNDHHIFRKVSDINSVNMKEKGIKNNKDQIEDKEIAFPNKITTGDKQEIGLPSQLNDKNYTSQIKNPIIEQVFTKHANTTSTGKINTGTENSSNNINVQEIENNLADKCGTNIKSTNDTNKINSNANESCSDKDKIDNHNINLKINKEILKSSDKLEANIVQKDVCKIPDLKDSRHPMTCSIVSQIDNDIDCTKDMNVKVQDNSNAKQCALSVAPTHKDNLELQKITKVSLEPWKITSKDTQITQTILPKQIETKKEVPKKVITKPNNCNSAVPFGKWTEANRQEFLNKIKETKIPTNNSNTNQIKQTNDLNRRDVLKKFDSQRQSTATLPTKVSDSSMPTFSSKMDTTAFVNKSTGIQRSSPTKPVIPPSKTQPVVEENQIPLDIKKVTEEEGKEVLEQRIIINSQELIDNTIEGIITRALKMKTTTPVHMKEKMTIHTVENPKDSMPLPGSLDDIEMKMNELHGFSFMERPVQESSPGANLESKPYNKPEDNNLNRNSKIPSLLPFKMKEQHKGIKETVRDDTSDEEIIEHEPITGDIDVGKQSLISLLSCKETFTEPKKDAIITEKDFDKFARRNSITYENRLTVKFDGKEKHKVVQTVVEKEVSVKKLSRNELLLAESKAKSVNKHHAAARHNNHTSKIPTLKLSSEKDAFNKNYQSSVQIAYQTALTAKRSLECPITMIEDKPVKVVFLDTNVEYTPIQLNVQGQELSPSKNHKAPDTDVHNASESIDSNVLDSTNNKRRDEKCKIKHQRKQVFTPVDEEPEMQLIEPSDLGIKVSPTKKRKTEEKTERNTKNLVPKKTYLLNRSIVNEHTESLDQPKSEDFSGHNINTAIDNLVKAAELIENQSESSGTTQTSMATETPVKRGRGRPRKYPLPEAGSDTIKPPSPQKKPRLIEVEPADSSSDSEAETDASSDGEIPKINWTMGKIDQNIVCPICTKLFRTEDVLFKHVKHCTGPSPNRSDSDKRSLRKMRLRDSQDTELCNSECDNLEEEVYYEDEDDDDEDEDEDDDEDDKTGNDSEEVIVIEDTPVKQKSTDEKAHPLEDKKGFRKTKQLANTNIVCEYCGKTFRQMSYLTSHKLQHKNEDTKNLESDSTKNSELSCEVCEKDFRKLHHLVQHRLIHNPGPTSSRSLRKSSEVSESSSSKTQNDDASAGFRCEPCDKSFRKLHHLVEHRETHDGINKKGNTTAVPSTTETSKSILTHQCDVCKNTFKKLADLMEHKEQHYETSSEKSDDKSVKSSLSTKDIIHECSLCYMVFPNEHSLTKHTVICLRKKKQSAAKQAVKQVEAIEGEKIPESDNVKPEEDMPQDVKLTKDTYKAEEPEVKEISVNNEKDKQEDQQVMEDIKNKESKDELEDKKLNLDVKPSNDVVPKKRHSVVIDKAKADDIETPAKIKKVDVQDHVIILDTPTPNKKTNKDKVALTVTKRHKVVKCPSPVTDNVKSIQSNDDDEIRYMLNPNFKEEDSAETKCFMKVRALKRSSLQIERPSSKDLLERRTSLQHAPKMPRLKAKPVESKPRLDHERPKAVTEKLTAVAEVTDSDDSDVKYSFPEQETKTVDRKVKRQSVVAKRKSLVGIAKRKSLGKAVSPKTKPKKRVAAEAGHRCDCGQLFGSAALLARHTSLAHTPPRIRKRRSPPPEILNTKPITKPTITKPAVTKPAVTKPAVTKPAVTKPAVTKTTNTKPINKKSKPDVTKSNKTIGVATRKSSVSNVSNNEMKSDSGKSVKSDSFKTLRSAKSVNVSDKFKRFEKKK